MKMLIVSLSLLFIVVSGEEKGRLRAEPRDLMAQVIDRIGLIQSELELLVRQFQRTLIGNARVSRLISEKIPSVEDIESITSQLRQTDRMVSEMIKLTTVLRTPTVDGRQLPGLPGVPGMEQIMAMFSQMAAQFQQLSGLLGGITSGLVRAGGTNGTAPGGMPNPLEPLTQILAQLAGNLGTMGESFRIG